MREATANNDRRAFHEGALGCKPKITCSLLALVLEKWVCVINALKTINIGVDSRRSVNNKGQRARYGLMTSLSWDGE